MYLQSDLPYIKLDYMNFESDGTHKRVLFDSSDYFIRTIRGELDMSSINKIEIIKSTISREKLVHCDYTTDSTEIIGNQELTINGYKLFYKPTVELLYNIYLDLEVDNDIINLKNQT